MKKALGLVLVAALALWYTSCGDDDDKCTAGELDCTCDNGTCGTGLKCENAKCVSCPVGSKDCACGTSDACDDGLACYTYEDNSKACRLEGLCCDDEAYIKIEGAVIDLAAQTPAEAAVGAYGANAALTGGGAAATTTSAATGAFAFDCFDISTAALGMIILVDDKAGAAEDTYYPTFTGVMGIPGTDQGGPGAATCLLSPPGATAFAISKDLVAALAAGISGFDAETNGFVIGNVLDGDRNPLAGATVHVYQTTGDPLDITDIKYIGFDAQGVPTFDSESTTAYGLYVIKGDATEIQGFPPPSLVAEKDGYTFQGGVYLASALPAKGYYVPVVADPLP